MVLNSLSMEWLSSNRLSFPIPGAWDSLVLLTKRENSLLIFWEFAEFLREKTTHLVGRAVRFPLPKPA